MKTPTGIFSDGFVSLQVPLRLKWCIQNIPEVSKNTDKLVNVCTCSVPVSSSQYFRNNNNNNDNNNNNYYYYCYYTNYSNNNNSNNNSLSVAVLQRPQVNAWTGFLVVGAGHARGQLHSTRAPADSV